MKLASAGSIWLVIHHPIRRLEIATRGSSPPPLPPGRSVRRADRDQARTQIADF
jgi:hypothetical protein